jgi:hypoxanthine phosphoribosyltransferase
MRLPASDDQHLWVCWDAYHRAIEQLALLVQQSGWQFDQVLCLARGGLRPGDVLSRIFDVPLAILSTSSYRAGSGTLQGELDIGKFIALSKGSLGGRILLVDDLVDSGVTLQKVQLHLQAHFPAVTGVKTAVIWCKAEAAFAPDFCLHQLATRPWIHQPFEIYDDLRASQLAAHLQRDDLA